jgi:hypothetical protein
MKTNKTQKIIFKAQDDHVLNVRQKPEPAAKFIPDWWKNIKKYANEENKFDMSPGPAITVKQCAPAFDALVSGYMITLWADLFVTQKNGTAEIHWGTDAQVIDRWQPSQSSQYEIPKGFNPTVFKYTHGWIIKTPPGWSTMFLHPIGYPNLPIRAIQGIVDTDIKELQINCPFVLEEGFEGVIPKGTPMAQLIPIKRANWESEIDSFKGNSFLFNAEKLKTELYGYYSSRREKKSYK